MLRIGVLASHGGSNLQAIIDYFEKEKIDAEIVTVVSNNKSAYALERAKNKNIDTIVISRKNVSSTKEYSELLIEHFGSKSVDLIVLAGFMVILDEIFIKHFENKILNIHPSLIPAFCGQGYYGLRVHEEALKRGVKVTGATVHFVNEVTDGGPIVIQKAVEVLDTDTPETLQKRVMEEAEWKILPEAIRLIAENKILVEGGFVRRIK